MTPSRVYPEWNKRYTDSQTQREPYKRYYFICEGSNTEVWYFKKLIDLRKKLGINPVIDLRLLEKTEEDATNSNPKKLIEFAKKEKKNKKNNFSRGHDKAVVVFDLDVFKSDEELRQTIKLADEDDILAISNPCFELYLLLHFEDAYNKYIVPNYTEILQNKKVNKHNRYLTRMISAVSGMNPKENSKIGELAEKVPQAIKEEKHINESRYNCLEKLTCNIGAIIDEIIQEGK